MRKLMAILLCFLCVCPAASAAETKYVALIVSGGPNGEATEKLLEGLNARDAKVTCFPLGEKLERQKDFVGKMLEAGHEFGIQGYSGGSMAQLSRRTIAKSFADTRALLGSHVRFLQPPEGICSDGVRQVAEVTGLAIIDCRLDIRRWAGKGDVSPIVPVVEAVRDGDIIFLGDETPAAVNTSLAMVDRLRQRGFRFVTLSELARIRGVIIHPGRTYTAFPPTIEEK